MMLLRSLPDFSSIDAELAQRFEANWGSENCIIWGRARRAEFGPVTHNLSIRAAWGGVQHCQFNGRTIAIDDDNFLILNDGRVCATRIYSTRSVESLVICFRPGLAERTYGAMAASIEQALAHGDTLAQRTAEFAEHLHLHDRSVSPVLRFIKAHVIHGLDDEAWYEEQLIFLLQRMQTHHRRVLDQVDRLQHVRAATRREIYRRVRLATDYLHTHYAQGVNLGALASVAFLSKYHFLRLFTLVHRITPFEYLQRKRAQVAARLLQSTQLTVGEIAACVGFTTRSALLRQLRRLTGLAPRQIRARNAAIQLIDRHASVPPTAKDGAPSRSPRRGNGIERNCRPRRV